MTILKLHEDLLNGKTTAEKLALAHLSKIKSSRLNTFITLCEEKAYAEAKKADARIRSGKNVTKLTGIPIAIKDILAVKGVRTTCGSKILENYIPPYSATVVKKLEDAGAVILGKLNMDEFAMGSSNEHSAFGAVKNPHDETRIPGGSSGGSAASVASSECVATLGTDTGGSIRQPASMCGVVGLKPTYGRVSRNGLVAFASSLDHIGPLTRTVSDSAIMLQAISGHDVKDSTSLNAPVPDYLAELKKDIKGLKLGVPKEYFEHDIADDVKESVNSAIETLKKAGASIRKISLPHTEYAVATYYIIAPAEASANLARYDGIRYGYREKDAQTLEELYQRSRTKGFGAEVKLRIMIGTYVLSAGYYDAYYKKAQCVRTLIKNDFVKAFKDVDAIISPATPTSAFKLGEKLDDPLQMYLADIFTIPADLAGLPALVVPCKVANGTLPIGLQIIGKHLDEGTILRIANVYEQTA